MKLTRTAHEVSHGSWVISPPSACVFGMVILEVDIALTHTTKNPSQRLSKPAFITAEKRPGVVKEFWGSKRRPLEASPLPNVGHGKTAGIKLHAEVRELHSKTGSAQTVRSRSTQEDPQGAEHIFWRELHRIEEMKGAMPRWFWCQLPLDSRTSGFLVTTNLLKPCLENLHTFPSLQPVALPEVRLL